MATGPRDVAAARFRAVTRPAAAPELTTPPTATPTTTIFAARRPPSARDALKED